MTHHTIAYLPGDGIGPEVGDAALTVLDAVMERFGLTIAVTKGLIGGAAIDDCGDPLPDDTLAICKASHAVLLGAVGGPKWSDPDAPVRPEQGLLKLRKELNAYANLRPVRLFAGLEGLSPLRPDLLDGVDLMVVRELVGGLYFGERSEGDGVASDSCTYSAEEIERVVRMAFVIAQGRRKKLTSVDKANVLATSRLWRRVVNRVAPDYPDVTVEHVLVDAMAMYLIARPADFDVIVTENLFGDILSDESSMLAGSMGLLASASLGDGGPGVFEPIHGSAPDIAGQDKANPAGMLLSLAMLLRDGLKLDEAASAIESALAATFAAGVRTGDLGGSEGTRSFAEAVAARVRG